MIVVVKLVTVISSQKQLVTVITAPNNDDILSLNMGSYKGKCIVTHQRYHRSFPASPPHRIF